MGTKTVTLPISCVLVLIVMLVGLASSDFQQERNECTSQLTGLATCLPYVGGEAKTPTLDCCSGLKQVLDKSEKCLCLLIKNRDNPNLGLKVNTTLAATLPSACHAPINVTDCINLLHLPPSSPEAKVFEGYANLTKGTSASSKVPAAIGNSTGSNSSAEEKSDCERANRLLVAEMICGFLLWAFLSFGM